MKISCIYKITSIRNGKFYVGSAVCFYNRTHVHKSELLNNKHCNNKLQNHVNKYGIEDLEFSVLEAVEDKNKLIEREQFYIDTLNPFFNILPTAGSCLGYKYSAETRLKISRSKLGKKHTQEAKDKMSLSRTGKPSPKKGKPSPYIPTEEFRLKRRAIATERYEKFGHFDKDGKSSSPETIKKRVESRSGYSHSEETKRKIGEANKIKTTEHWKTKKGFTHSEETKQKMRDAANKRIYDDEWKEKRREERKRYIVSEESKIKMSESAKNRFRKAK